MQSWYNQSIAVDPANGNHVLVGLEEVYETRNGGSNWTTVDPYWNFYFKCWAPDSSYPPNGGPNRCPLAPHTDQHSMTIGKVGGVPTLFIGNDGGVYSHPLDGHINTNGNGDDWKSLNDGTMDALQYYYVGVGKLADNGSRPDLGSGDPVLVSGGLQDNGGSLLRPGAAKMVSNFGGDGGDVLVDPNNGCNIVQEYVQLTMEVTQTCANPGPAHPNAFLDPNDATTFNIAPPDVNAQFIAPFTANDKNINQWIAAGTSLWYQDKGFAIRSPAGWQKIYSLPSPALTFTAVAYSGDSLLATWCGPCSNGGAPLRARRGRRHVRRVDEDVDRDSRSTCRSAAQCRTARCRALRSIRTTRTTCSSASTASRAATPKARAQASGTSTSRRTAGRRGRASTAPEPARSRTSR